MTRAEVGEVMAELEALGTAQNRKIYGRHGVSGPMFGVSYGNLEKLVKQLRKAKPGPELALALWASGNHDARVLAAKIAPPDDLDAARLEEWADELDDYVLTDAVSGLAARSPAADELRRAWIEQGDEWRSTAGWSLVSATAMDPDGGAGDDELAPLLDTIEREIHGAPNRTRYAMNNALIAIGAYRPALRDRALEVARAIGPVEVDHGETGCKTPDAGPYIEKTAAYLEKKAAKKKKKA